MVRLDDHLLDLGRRQSTDYLIAKAWDSFQVLAHCLIHSPSLFDQLLIILWHIWTISWRCSWCWSILAQNSTLLSSNLHFSIANFHFSVKICVFEFTLSHHFSSILLPSQISIDFIALDGLSWPNFMIDEFVEVVDNRAGNFFDVYFLNFIFQPSHVFNQDVVASNHNFFFSFATFLFLLRWPRFIILFLRVLFILCTQNATLRISLSLNLFV